MKNRISYLLIRICMLLLVAVTLVSCHKEVAPKKFQPLHFETKASREKKVRSLFTKRVTGGEKARPSRDQKKSNRFLKRGKTSTVNSTKTRGGVSYSSSNSSKEIVRTEQSAENKSSKKVQRKGKTFSKSKRVRDKKTNVTNSKFVEKPYKAEKRKPQMGLYGKKMW